MFLRFRAPLTTIAFVLSAVLLAAAFARFAQADNDNVVTSTAQLPFAGSFFDSVTRERVHISGAVHVVTHVAFSPSATTLDLHAVLPADVDATGETTGIRYISYGANSLLQPYPPGPIRSAVAQVQFLVKPPTNPDTVCGCPFRPCPDDPLPHCIDSLFLQLHLQFATDGTLLVGGEAGSTVRLCGERACTTD